MVGLVVRLDSEAHDVTMASPKVGYFPQMASRPVLAGFDALYAQHYEAVFRAALRVTGNPTDAEDVLQTVFLRVLAQRDFNRGRSASGRLLPSRGGQRRCRHPAATGVSRGNDL